MIFNFEIPIFLVAHMRFGVYFEAIFVSQTQHTRSHMFIGLYNINDGPRIITVSTPLCFLGEGGDDWY